MSAALCHPSDSNHHPYPPRIRYQSNAVASTSTTPPITPPTLPSSQHQSKPDDVSNTVAPTLTTHGIRVRDFAYENTLPPVTSVPRFSVQVQPRPRTLQRTYNLGEYTGHDFDEESDEEDPSRERTFYIDSNGTGLALGGRYRKKGAALARTLTEPVDDVPPSQGFNTRALVFTQPSRRPPSPAVTAQDALPPPTTPHKPTHSRPPHSRPISPIFTAPQSQPSINGESQESDVWVDTPLVTPNGSLQWPVQNASAFPASQLESMLPQLPDVDGDVTMSQLGFTPERSQWPCAPAPESQASCSRPRHSTPPANSQSPTPSPGKSRAPSDSPAPRTRPPPTAPLSEAPPRRYDFRHRQQQSTKPTPAASRATSRTRTSKQAKAARPAGDDASVPVPPPAKKRKVTPPGPAATRGRKKDGAVKENR